MTETRRGKPLASAMGFERACVSLTRGIYIAPAPDCAGRVRARLEGIADREEEDRART
jgi:hypothetical protein